MNIKEHMKNIVKDKLDAYKFNKKYDRTQNMLRDNVRHNAQTMFNPSSLSWILVTATLFLQLISLSTTYSGSKVYFGGINLPFGLSAPFLFSISIQTIVFSLSNYLRKNYRIWTIFILLLSSLCSTYFSYIGIYNYINSPIAYLEERYNQIYHNMSDKYKITIDNSNTEMKECVFDITNKIQKEYSRLLKENDSYTKLSNQLSKLQVSNNIIKPNIKGVSKPNISSYGKNLDKYYEDMARYNAAISNIIGQTTQQNASLQSSIYENKAKSLLGGKSLDEFTKEHIDLQSNKELIDNVISSLHSQISQNGQIPFDKKIIELQQYCINYITSNSGESNTFNTILTNMYTIYSSVTSSDAPESFYNTLNSFITLGSHNQTFMKDLNTVKQEVYVENYNKEPNGDISLKLTDTLLLYSKLQSEIKNGAYILNSISPTGTIIDLNNQEFVLENMYILPIKNLFVKTNSLGIAWFCFAFAALIDGLTILFALMHRENTKTLLANSNNEIVKNSENLTEELLLSSLAFHPVSDESKSSTHLSLEHLAKFIKSFEITDIGMENGYSLYCPLDKLKEYQIFLSILCQFNLAKIVSKESFYMLEAAPTISEFKQLIKKQPALEVLDEVASTTWQSKADYYVLLKTKFIIWANKKFTTASSNRELSSIVSNILKNLDQSDHLN